jgi:xanthine dehydrogenase YagS FAD-binding subunit
MRQFTHINVRTVSEACAALEKYRGKGVLNAGGTDLIPALKGDFLPNYPRAVINIKMIPGLSYIKEQARGLRIGALTRLSEIGRSGVVTDKYRVLHEAAKTVASPPIRNVATLGGNLCQMVRCWYYRYPRSLGGPINCYRKGGDACPAVRGDHRFHALMGGNRCFAVCPSDIAVALSALDAEIRIAGRKGERTTPVIDFYTPLGIVLKRDELVKDIRIPRIAAPRTQRFLKFTLRKPVDFAIVSVASIITLEKGICTDARIALGAIAPMPIRARVAEEYLLGRYISKSVAAEAAEKALANAKPIAMNEYRIEIAKILVARAILGSCE